MKKFIPRVILITGCSSGFGLLTAARLAAAGHKVIATMRNLDKKQDLLDEVKNRRGEIFLLSLDITDKTSIQSAIDNIGEKYGYIDVLINNAGYGIGGAFEDLSEGDIRSQFETNFFGVQNLTRAVIPFMRQRKQGKIINISSISGLVVYPILGAYAASKWALEAFSESLRFELKMFGIDVLLVEPGTYRTKIFEENARYALNYFSPQSPYFEISTSFKQQCEERVKKSRRNPEEIAILIEKLILSQNPSFRNIPDTSSRFLYFARKYLPYRLYSFLFNKIFFLKIPQSS